MFNLGECDINRHKNTNVNNGRVKLLNDHYNRLYAFAAAYKAYKNANDEQKNEKKKRALIELAAVAPQHFGFTQLILNGQYVI